MNSKRLCQDLEIDADKLAELIDDGLPWHGNADSKKFDEEEVVDWLISSGRAEPKRRYARTHREIAEALGLRQKTVILRHFKFDGFTERIRPISRSLNSPMVDSPATSTDVAMRTTFRGKRTPSCIDAVKCAGQLGQTDS